MCETMKQSVTRTNRLKCGACKRRIKKGEHVIFYFEDGKFDDVLCTVCDYGKSQIRAIEEEQIMADVMGIGQWHQ